MGINTRRLTSLLYGAGAGVAIADAVPTDVTYLIALFVLTGLFSEIIRGFKRRGDN